MLLANRICVLICYSLKPEGAAGLCLLNSLATGRQDPLVFIFYNEMLARVDMLVIVYIRADLFIFVVDRRDWKN